MRLPVYDQQQVAPQAAPDVHAEALVDPAGGAVGQGLQQLGSGLEKTGDVMLDAKDRFDAIAATNAHTQLKHDVASGLYGVDPNAPPAPLVSADTGSPIKQGVPDVPTGPSQQAQQAAGDGVSGVSPKGVLNERGMAASAYSHPTLDWMAKRRDEIAAGLQNDNQRRKFLASSAGTLEDARVNVERHTAQQNQLVQEASLHAATAATLSGVANNYFDPASVERQLMSLEPSIKALALSPEDAAAKIANVRQEAYKAVVGQYIADKDWKGAQAALTVHQEALGYGKDGAETVERLKHSVGVLRDQQEAVQAAGSIVDTAKRTDGTYDMAAIDRKALELPPERRTDLVMKELGVRRALASQNNGGLASNYFNDALSAYQKSFNLNDINPETATWLQESDPKGWKAILDEDRQHQDRAHRGAKTPETPDQLGTFYELKDTYRELSPDELAKLDPKAVVHDALVAGVGLKRAGELADQVVQLRGQARASDSALTKSQGDLVMDALEETGHTELRHGVLRIKKGDEQLRSKVEQEILKHQASLRGALPSKEKGYTLDGDDLQKFLGPMLAPVVTEKNLIFPDKKAPAVAAPGYQSQAIPARDADQIRSALQGSGRDATPDAIQEVWRAHHGGAPQPQAEPAGTTKVEDLAKDPQALSNLHPAAQQAVKRLAPKLIVLPAMTITASPPKAKAKSETLGDTVKGMGVDAGSLDEALKGAK